MTTTLKQAEGIIRNALGTITEHTCVVVTNASKVTPADNTNSDHNGRIKGIALNGGVADDPITIVFTGFLTNVAWNWTPGLPIYYSTAGGLTQTRPASGNVQQIGIAENATTIFVDIKASEQFQVTKLTFTTVTSVTINHNRGRPILYDIIMDGVSVDCDVTNGDNTTTFDFNGVLLSGTISYI